MKKKKKFPVKSACFFTLCLLLSAYYLAGVYYRQSFGMGKFINGVYCTGKSIQTINDELAGQFANESIHMQDLYGNVYEIPLRTISYKADYTSQLKAVQNSQSVLGWGFDALSENQRTIMPDVSFSEEAFWEVMSENGFMEHNKKDPLVEIRKGEDGYFLYDGRKNALNEEALFSHVTQCLQNQEFEIDVSGCYEDLPYTEEMQQTQKIWESVNHFQKRSIVYDMGDEKITLTPSVTADFLTVEGNEIQLYNNWPVVNEEGIRNFVGNLAKEFDTYGKDHVFEATRGEKITIKGGTYGNEMDQEAEIVFLTSFYESRETDRENAANHIPAYRQTAYVRGKKDLSDTYVEVDMTNQMLYYYENGELKLSSEVVTGNMSKKCDTPEGVNYVYSKQKNRTLRGPGYETFVYYWMPVNGNIGMHDATWRKEFGGEIYKTKGSHGCINLPKAKAGELYDMLTVGVPVVMFY